MCSKNQFFYSYTNLNNGIMFSIQVVDFAIVDCFRAWYPPPIKDHGNDILQYSIRMTYIVGLLYFTTKQGRFQAHKIPAGEQVKAGQSLYWHAYISKSYVCVSSTCGVQYTWVYLCIDLYIDLQLLASFIAGIFK